MGALKFVTAERKQQDLMRKTRTMNFNHPYVSCRMNPFKSVAGSTGIPDGNNSNYVVNDSLTYDDISCTTANGFSIQTHATLPFSASVIGLGATATSDISINGNAFTNRINTTTAGTSVRYPLSYLPAYNVGSYTPGVLTTDPYQSTTARLVACGYRLIYTGQASTCSGTVTITPNSMAFSEAGEVTADVGAVIANPNNTASNISVGTDMITADFTTGRTFTKDSLVLRPEVGVYILPRHRSKDFKIIGTQNTGSFVSFPTTTTTIGGAVILDSLFCRRTIAAGEGGIIWYDNDWSGFQVVVSGMQTGATFRWETAWCMEYTPSATSAIAPFTHKASSDQPNAMKTAAKLTNDAPPSLNY